MKSFTTEYDELDGSGYEVIYYDYDEPGVVPERPQIMLFNDMPLAVGQELSASCLSRNGEPASEIIWFLDTESLDSVLEFEEIENRLTSVVSIVQRNVTADDDNKALICQARHPGYSEGFSEVKIKLNVNYKPIEMPTKTISQLEVGKSVDISVLFRSNPKPSSLRWVVGDRKVYYGAETSKYISREISTIGHNFWNASLHIKNLTNDDTLISLQVRNFMGATEYSIEIKGLCLSSVIIYFYFHPKQLLLVDGDLDGDLTTTEEEVDSTTLAQFNRKNFEDESTSKEFDFTTEKMLNTTENFDVQSTTKIIDETVDLETTTMIESPITTEVEEIATTMSPIQNESIEENLIVQENLRNEMKTKVSRVMIFKRPIMRKIPDSTKTEPMVTVSQAEGQDFSLKFAEMAFIDVAAKAIIFWKTSLMAILILILVASLTYYRRRVIRLKALIIQKNLGNSYNQSCSHPHSTNNAYTPTYFPRRVASHESKLHSNYQGSSSISNCYSQTYNSSLHSYESIDEHIYAEIPTRKSSIASLESNSSSNINTSGN